MTGPRNGSGAIKPGSSAEQGPNRHLDFVLFSLFGALPARKIVPVYLRCGITSTIRWYIQDAGNMKSVLPRSSNLWNSHAKRDWVWRRGDGSVGEELPRPASQPLASSRAARENRKRHYCINLCVERRED